jgi:nucleoside-diphosphate-sugar epimerase
MKLFVFGLGYSALHFITHYGDDFGVIAGTVRTPEKATLFNDKVEPFVFGPEYEDPAITAKLNETEILLVSIPPGTSVDPVLARFGRKISAAPRLKQIIYLSTIGVYGDRNGDWVEETRLPTPKSERSVARLHAEKAWTSIAKGTKIRVDILRLAGIYGPGRNALSGLKAGTARRIVKEGQVFNRIHVEDVSQAIAAAITRDGTGDLFNICDDEPAPPQDVITYAASLMKIEPPPPLDFETADLTPMARTFYGENKRVRNDKLKRGLGVSLTYPTYREGLQALWEQGEGRG